ncbi:GntR family transcriptional regulator [Nocardiopsis sp. NPDC049922]|uniref:GntR family transcriptional regulator n=1 Tax=Nocardiopsis sp. NPDC049922 TaxID=3155157 RepID=UPI0033ED3910
MEPQRTSVDPPIKLAIADSLRMKIEKGQLEPGDSLPTLHELTTKWNCSITSAREALNLLKEQGLVSGGRGRPLRVRGLGAQTRRSSTRHQWEKDRVHEPEEERRKAGTSELETNKPIGDVDFTATYSRIPASKDVATALGVEEDSDVIQRVYETKDRKTKHRTNWSVSYIPVSLISKNPELLDEKNEPWPGGTQHQLSTVGIEIMKVVDEVTSRMSTTVERQLWGLDTGVPMLRVRRISYDRHGTPVEISDADYPADRTVLEFMTELKEW